MNGNGSAPQNIKKKKGSETEDDHKEQISNSPPNRSPFATNAPVFQPPSAVQGRAHINSMEQYKKMYEDSVNPKTRDAFWDQMAKENISWSKPYNKITDGGFDQGDITWFQNGQLNVCYNCVDRHVERDDGKGGDDVAIIWEGDHQPTGNKEKDAKNKGKPVIRKVTYRELQQGISRVANVLLSHGVRKGDPVIIYMPLIPEAAMVMLACARIGAVHSVVFAGFSAESLRDRINNCGAKIVVTANEGLRGDRTIPLKRTVDEALMGADSVRTVLVFPHTNSKVPWHMVRDYNLKTEMAEARPYCPITTMDAEDPLFLLYTSGSTGQPKGLLHTSAGFLLYAMMTHKYIFNYFKGDVYACMADIGWITGHTYIVYGPLANGATTFMFEGVPTYPNPSRYWDMIDRHNINILYTAPTAIRALMAFGDKPVTGHKLDSLRVLGSVGEPINPEAWKWYYEIVGRSKCAIVDTYWQTETGGIILTPLPGAIPTKPGSATLPFFGVQPVVLDAQSGKEVEGNDVSGVLAIKNHWPGIARSIYRNHSRYLATYLHHYHGVFFTGDGVTRDKDGYYWITGRVDDVINKAGHRLGTAEIESALVKHPACSEAAVVGIPDEVRGQAILAYVTLASGETETADLIAELKNEVRKIIGSLAVPDHIVITPSLPKTRSGKIMRRILRKVGEGNTKDLGDTSTLADPDVLDFLITKVNEQTGRKSDSAEGKEAAGEKKQEPAGKTQDQGAKKEDASKPVDPKQQ